MLTKEASLHDWIFNSEVDPTTRRRWLPFSNTLVLQGLNVYEALGIDDPEKAKWRDFVFYARGRDLNGAMFDNAVLRKIDFEGAQLRGASFFRSQLQGASLIHAHLQGATFLFAQLQGALLQQAQLQGAALPAVQGQGADFANAQLQGARLEDAYLQGASLAGAQLQGASLIYAQLQGAQLDNAQLQGATLVLAQLRGVSFQFASLEATDLSHAFLWRSNGGGPSAILPGLSTAARVVSVRLGDVPETWNPVWLSRGKAEPWDSGAYQDLLKVIEALPASDLRKAALDRIRRLDCANPDLTLASCDPSVQVPAEMVAWRNSLESARVDDTTYFNALAMTLKTLVCSGRDDAPDILSLLLNQSLGYGSMPALGATYVLNRLAATGPEAPALIDFIMSKDCPVSASLTDPDRAKLLQVKQAIEAAKKPGG